MERIALGNDEFEGRNNAYLLTGAGEVALVDTAVATDEPREDLRSGLARQGYGFEDIDAILVTHWHYDHAGLVGEIQAASGATAFAHVEDAPLVSHDEEAFTAREDRQEAWMDEWGMPREKQAALDAVFDASRPAAGEPAAVEPVEAGEVIEVAGRSLEVIHAPGHTAGLACFAFDGPEGAEAFVGDAILPVYTPNIGGADVRVDRPLETYARSLESLIDRGFSRVWPGHREPIEDPAGRAETILQHHRDRTRRVVEDLRDDGPADAWTVSARLFGDLEGIHILHGPGEAWAHLDHLERHGLVEPVQSGYRLAEGTTEADLPALG